MEETQRMRTIVEALVVLAKADENSLLQIAHPFSLRSVLEDLAEDASAMGESRGIEVRRSKTADTQLTGDERLIRLALYNLVKNAVEHAPDASVVNLNAQHLEDCVRIEVINQGDPIPPYQQERIFDRFYRANPHHKKGIGLGLNLASEIAKAHRGSTCLMYSDDRGTCFAMELPLQHSDNAVRKTCGNLSD
jgi:signal transduction histidine kinase